ncbi:MAG: hypothetical protein DRO15_07135 [Thermoprotei archaeon]|nr:MAG: hypothetical protein DRO15_07135 [Thermoprotei archaeon]
MQHTTRSLRRLVWTNLRQKASQIKPTSLPLTSLHEDSKKIYEELRLRKIVTENMICEMLSFAEIARWRKEEMEIGRDKHLIHETVKSILPKV